MARPEHKPTAATRRRVSVAAGGGMTHEAIALALKISEPTLRKHYADELAAGAHGRRMDVLEKLYTSARRGSTSAARAYLAHQAQFTPLAEGQLQDGGKGSKAPKPVKVGKKEQAQVDAVGAESGTDWDGILPGTNVVAIR